MNEVINKDLEFYQKYQRDKPNKTRLFFRLGRKNYNLIKAQSSELINYLLENEERIKTIGVDVFISLVSDYGLYNIDNIVINSNDRKVSNLIDKNDLIDYINNEIKYRFSNLRYISLKDSPMIRTLFSNLFDSELYKNNSELIDKLFSLNGNPLSIQESIELIKSDVDMATLPTYIFNNYIQQYMKIKDGIKDLVDDISNEKLETFFKMDYKSETLKNTLNSFNNDQIKEILNIVPNNLIRKYFDNYDIEKDYLLNTWILLEKEGVLRSNYNIASQLLKSLNIKPNYGLLKESPLYEGIPINLSDKITKDQYNNLIPISYQENIPFDKLRELYNYFNARDIKYLIKDIIDSIDNDNIVLRCNDNYYGINLLNYLKNGDYEKILEYENNSGNLFSELMKKEIIIPNIKDNLLLYSIRQNNYFTVCEWLKKLRPEEQLPLSFVGVFSLDKARDILDNKGIYDQVINQDVFIKNKDNLDFQVSITAAMLVFDTFNNPSTVDNIKGIYETFGEDTFITLFKNISMRLNPELLADMKENYSILADIINNFSFSQNIKEIEKRKYLKETIAKIDSYDFKSVVDIIKHIDIYYDNVHPNCAHATRQMQEMEIPNEYYLHYQNLYNETIKRKGIMIPAISEEKRFYSYDSVRVWDDRLLNFDLERKINLPSTLKDNLFLNSNCRLVEVKDNAQKVIDQIYLQLDSNNNMYLSSLLKPNDKEVQKQYISDIIFRLKEEYETKGIKINFNVIDQPLEAIPNIDNILFVENPRVIKLKSSSRRLYEEIGIDSDMIKIANINRIAFGSAGNGDYGGELKYGDETANYIVGRDWFIKTHEIDNDGEHAKHLDFLGRYSKDESKAGGEEMAKCITDIVENFDGPVTVEAFATSYYLFSKLAAEGKIFILNDQYKVETGSGYHSDRVLINSYFLEDGSININYDEKINYSRFKKFAGELKSCNEMKFISPSNLTEEQQQQLEMQKYVYTKVVNRLVEHRIKDKHENFEQEEYSLIYDNEYSELQGKKELQPIGDLRAYSINYLRYVLTREQLASNLSFYTKEDVENRM